ncbi:TM1812 family CRISPR-associated protein [Anaerovibrio sp. RM50]|uniref:TM1812 family CRISPR-associated protein n=1 Tax=Anaerovibrio sp. RM50 TaxID=1200557 RepID=UPI0004870725|nr:TM1812 family CRISPR-associated protein [Anaerovibrio sp. RM50]
MGKTLMLAFLSDVKIGNDGKVSETEYKDVGTVHTTNESAVRYLVKEKEQIDHLFMFVSNKVKGNITYKGTNGEIKEYVDDSGTSISHVDYFKKRISDIITGDSSKYTEIEFNENNTPEESMECILEMADSIQKYIEPFSEDTQIILHADCTGGLRHANMLMMAVLRIMQYNGVKIGKLLYSNYQRKVVEEADPIYELFDFVSGAEEFANFGSANAISHYFDKKEQPKVLGDLLKAMNVFSEEIRLCHRRGLMKASENLKECIENFEKADEENINIRLVRQLKARIKKDYSFLLEEDFSILNLIKWCLEHDYLQQALTLYVEGVPDYLYEKIFFRQSDDMEKRQIIDDRRKENKEYTDGFFQLIVFDGKYKIKDESNKTKEIPYSPVVEMDKLVKGTQRVLYNKIKVLIPPKHEKSAAVDLNGAEKIISDIKKQVSGENKQYSWLVFTPHHKIEDFFTTLEEWRQNPLKLKNPDVNDVFYRYFADKLDLGDGYGIEKYNKIVDYARKMDIEDQTDFLVECKMEYSFRFMSFCNPEQNYFKLNVPDDIMRHILNEYGYFKSERNASNHARLDEDVITADELKEKMAKAVDYIIETEALCELTKD